MVKLCVQDKGGGHPSETLKTQKEKKSEDNSPPSTQPLQGDAMGSRENVFVHPSLC